MFKCRWCKQVRIECFVSVPEKIVVCGLHYTNSDDNTNLQFRDFLLPMIKEIHDFKTEPINIEIDEDQYAFRPIVTSCAADLPAKSKIQETKQFAGYDGCTYCEIHG